MDQADAAAASMKNFHAIVKGRTNGAHREFVANLISSGQTEVSSPEESDYLMVFCPVVSKVETNISKALENIPGGKPIILVVMHHTNNPYEVLVPSRRHVENPNIHLTVDCLFYEGRFLQCNRNYIAWVAIQKFRRVTTLPVPTSNDFIDPKLSWKKFFVEVTGNTDGAHQEIVSKLKSTGHIQVSSLEESDYHLIFCSEADISKSLENISGGKPIILVVMHHTLNPDEVVVPSRRQVDNQNIFLTVDCLFYEGQLLQCNRNYIAWVKVQKSLGVPTSQDPTPDDLINLSGTKFFVIVSGKTKEAHQEIVSKLKTSGQTEVPSREESDYLLVFCPITSRVGTDISEALENIPGGKPIILVVMHHTFSCDKTVAPSRRQVENRNVCLTVDCLFYEGKLLQCKRNDTAWADIQKSLGVSTSQDSTSDDFVDQGRGEESAARSNMAENSKKRPRGSGLDPTKKKKPSSSTQVLGTKFFVIDSGKTNEAHQEIVSKLKTSGQTEVSSHEESDYLLVFCPITLQVGTDISEALENIPGGKPIILVVMHHTSSHDQTVAPRQVENRNVCLTVDCLFYEGKLLQCKHNDTAWADIQKSLGVSTSQDSTSDDFVDLSWKKFFVTAIGGTNGAHEDIVAKLKSIGQTEASSHEESDYLLIFCSIVSEIDINRFMEDHSAISGGKPIILVVIHQASSRDKGTAPRRTQMNNPNVSLTVDCLFHEGKLLPCKHNDREWADIQKSLGVSTSQVSVSNDINNLLRKKIFIIVSGKTKEAHQDIVSKLKSSGQTEVSSHEESDYILVFCPITSRVGADISDALENIPGGKPIILVVMHHTFNPDHVVAPSRRQVDNLDVCLTVDCLFYEGELLKCERNDAAWVDIQKSLGISISQVPVHEEMKATCEGILSWAKRSNKGGGNLLCRLRKRENEK